MSELSLAAERILNPSNLTDAADVRIAPASPGAYGWWVARGTLDVPEVSYQEREGHQISIWELAREMRPAPALSASAWSSI